MVVCPDHGVDMRNPRIEQLHAKVGRCVDQDPGTVGFDKDGHATTGIAWLGGIAAAPVIPDPRHARRCPAAKDRYLHAPTLLNSVRKLAVVVAASASTPTPR